MKRIWKAILNLLGIRGFQETLERNEETTESIIDSEVVLHRNTVRLKEQTDRLFPFVKIRKRLGRDRESQNGELCN